MFKREVQKGLGGVFGYGERDYEGSEESLRPLPPLSLLVALLFWMGCAAAYYYFSVQPFIVTIALVVSLVISVSFSMCLGIARFKKKGEGKTQRVIPSILSATMLTQIICGAGGLFLGVLVGCMSAFGMKENLSWVAQDTKTQILCFEIMEDPHQSNISEVCNARTRLSNGKEITLRLYFNDSKPPRYGSIISARVNLKAPSATSAQYFWQNHLSASASVPSFEVFERSDLMGLLLQLRAMAGDLLDEYDSKSIIFLKAILCGDRSDLSDSEFYQEVKVSGLAHLVAVSGAHLVIVSSSIAALLRLFRAPRAIVIIVQIFFIGAYLVFTAFPLSAIRAAFMSIAALSSFYAHRRSSSLQALSLCIVIFIAVDPSSALSVSFLLSALSTLGIIVFSSLIQSWMKMKGRRSSSVQEALSLTLSSNIAILPLSAALFAQISLIAPLANIAAAFPFSFLCLYGLSMIVASLIVPPLAPLTMGSLLFCAEAFCELISLLASVPYAAIPAQIDLLFALVCTAIIFCGFWIWWPRLTRKSIAVFGAVLCCYLVVTIAFLPFFADDEIIMLDVGQGDAFLVRSNGATVLIDTGNQNTKLLKGLARQGVYHLDAVVISHADDDHCGSLEALRGVIVVDRVCLSSGTKSCDCISCEKLLTSAQHLVGEGGVRFLSMGDRISVGYFTLDMVWPHVFTDEGGNEDSLSLVARYEDWTALFCGDAEADELEHIVSEQQLKKVDILKVGHHGSRGAVTDRLLDQITPQLALVSVGEQNRYGHPAEEVLSILATHDVVVLRTDQGGDVVCKLSSNKMEVVSMR